MPVNLLQRALNQGIRESINEFDLDGARKALKYALSKKPDADTYYLASMLAETEKEKLKYLQKALDKDPFHEEAFAEYEHFTKQTIPTTKSPQKAKKPIKTASSNNWSAACYQLGYFIACGAGIVALGLLAPVIAAASVPAVIIGAVLAGVLVLGAGLGTIFKSVTAEHRITETLLDETSESFRANRRGDSPIKKGTDFMQTTAGKVTTAVVVTGLVTSAVISSSSPTTPVPQSFEASSSSRQPDYTGCYNTIYDNMQSMGLIYVDDSVEFSVHQTQVSLDGFSQPFRAVTLEGVEYQMIGNRDFGKYITNDPVDSHPIDWGICFFTGRADAVEFIFTATSFGDTPPYGKIKHSTIIESGYQDCWGKNREENCKMHGWTDEYGATAIYLNYEDNDQIVRFEIVK